jgi:mono/diheme cytochrome c family protein
MKCSAGVALLLLMSLTEFASAQPATLNPQQQLGQQLVSQSCGVCHLKPQITSQTFGPPLSKESAGGNEAVMRQVIMDGTPRMPGFKLQFEPAQIDAIVAYLKTVPAPPPAPPATPAR